MALITPNDGVNDPNSAAVLDVAIYFCRPNDSCLSPKRPISCRPNGHSGKNLSPKRLSPKRLSPKRLVAQMTVDRIKYRVSSIKTRDSSFKTQVSSFNRIIRKHRIRSCRLLETRVLKHETRVLILETQDTNFSNPRFV